MALKTLQYSFSTDVGKVRKENQDSYGALITKKGSLFLVCDGMGGVNGGAMASILATEVIIHYLSQFQNQEITPEIVSKALYKANSVVHDYGKKHSGYEEMGTTVLAFYYSKDKCFVCHVGDSRLYKITKGDSSQVTRDHTWVQELIDSGAMKADKAERSPVSHLLTRALGTRQEIEVEVLPLEMPQENDFYLLCTDGLYNSVSDESILSVTSEVTIETLDEVIENLVSRALIDGGKDNITVAGIFMQKQDKKGVHDEKSLPHIELSGSSGVSLKEYFADDADGDDLSSPLMEVAEEMIKDESLSDVYKGKVGNAYLFRYFLLGILASIVIFLTVAVQNKQEISLDRDEEVIAQSGSEEDAGSGTKAKSKIIKLDPRLQKIKEEYNARKKAKIKSVFSLSRSPLSNNEYLQSYINKIKDSYFTIEHSPPLVRLPAIKKDSKESKPVRPIVWENEARLMSKFKKEFKQKMSSGEKAISDETSDKKTNGSSEMIRSEAEIYSIIYDKESIRVRINDLDEKIRQLALRDKEERESRKKDKLIYISILNDKIDEINSEYNRVKERIELLNSYLNSINNKKLEQIAERMLVFDSELLDRLKKIRSVREKLKQTKNIFNVQSDQIALANKISALNRELSFLLDQLKSRLKLLITTQLSSDKEKNTKLMWLSYVLEMERNAQARALGFLSINKDLSPRMAHELYDALVEERNMFYEELLELKETVPDTREFTLSLAEFSRLIDS